MIHTRLTGQLAALLFGALLLAGCSSGGGEPTVSQGVHDLLQHELDTALEELKAEQAAKQSAETARRTAQAEVTRLTGLIGNMNDAPSAATTASLHARLNHAQAEVTRLTDDLTAANTRVTELNTLVGDATNPAADSLRGEVAKLKTDLATAQGRVEGLESQLGTAQTRLEEEETKREAAEQEAATAKTEAERQVEEAQRQADANARASGLMTAFSSGTFPTATEATMGVSHMPGGSLTFRRPSALPAKGSAPSVPGGWRSASYSGPRGSVGTDTVYLYTNIQAPGSKEFWKEHGESVPESAIETLPEGVTVTVSGFGTQAKELYPGDGGVLDGDTTTSETAARSIGGTYDGYSGTFKCDSGCEIEAADDGALTFTGEWTFTASLTARRSSNQAEQDTEFLYFGIWAFEPTDPADTTNTHNLRWAAGGNAGDISSENFTALTGEATFTGGAIGKYALAKVTGREARAARTGTFTATARFTAIFGSSPTLSGRITGFKEGGSDLGSDWHVFLGSSASEAATLTVGGVTTPGVASGAIDGDNATGAWAATLHGSDNQVLTDRAKYPASRYPVADVAGVAGWFRAAAGTNAAIAGAFGAACTTGTMCAR